MKADVELSPEDIQGILFSVLEYNGYKPASITWVGADGLPVAQAPSARVACESGGLRIRVAPEGTTMEEKLKSYTSLVTGIMGKGQ